MASGALWLQFRPLILHLYQTPGGKQENRHVGSNLSLRFILCASLCVLLWSLTNRINVINRPLRLSIRLLSICPFHHARAASLKSSSKRLSTSTLVQRTSYYRPALYQICATEPPSSDVPHSGTLLCFDSHIVPMSYGSNQACLCLITEAPRAQHKRLVSYSTPSVGQLEMHRTFYAARTKTMMNNRARRAKFSLIHAPCTGRVLD